MATFGRGLAEALSNSDLARDTSLTKLIPQQDHHSSTHNLLEAGERNARFAARQDTEYVGHHALSRSKVMRNRRSAELSRSIERRTRSQERVQAVLRAKREFQERCERLRAKVGCSSDDGLKKLAMVILKAYAEKQRHERRNTEVANFVHSKLQNMKLRRMLKALRAFTAWKRHWVKNVSQNFERQRMKQVFTFLYLNTVLKKYKRRRIIRLKARILSALRADGISEIQRTKIARRQFQRWHREHLLRRGLYALYSWRGIEVFVRRQKGMRNRQILREALGHWQFYTAKMKEYKQDEITKQFADYDKAIICRGQPGEPLVVMESNDSCKYFDISAKYLNVCEGARSVASSSMSRSMPGVQTATLFMQRTTRINLQKYEKVLQDPEPSAADGAQAKIGDSAKVPITEKPPIKK